MEIRDISEYSDWNTLDSFVNSVKEDEKVGRILRRFKRNPITKKSIEKLVTDGWRVLFKKIFFDGVINAKNQIIIDSTYFDDPYGRDVVLFHELVHIFHPEKIFRRAGFPEWSSSNPNYQELLVEWLARQSRAKPTLLRSTIISFQLQPVIYDRVSYLAFNNSRQLTFSFIDKGSTYPFLVNFMDFGRDRKDRQYEEEGRKFRTERSTERFFSIKSKYF